MSGTEDLFAVCQRHFFAVSERVHAALAGDHPAAREALTQRLELLLRAIGGEWEPYELVLRAQGVESAGAPLALTARLDLATAFQEALTPLLVETYGAIPVRLTAALAALQRIVVRSLIIVTESWVAERSK